MKLGVYLHLGPLYGGDWPATLVKAKSLREAGVRHVFACNAPVDTVAMAQRPKLWLETWKPVVEGRLAELADIGLTVGVRPMPLCAEQVVIEHVDGSVVAKKDYTPDFTIRRTSIDAARELFMTEASVSHYVYACHEAHDILDGKQRRWLVEQLGPRAIIYYGHRGLWNKYGSDFGTCDLPHVVHVALNAAGATDSSAAGNGVVPRDCTAKQIGDCCDSLAGRTKDWNVGLPVMHAHINVTASTPVPRLVAIGYEAAQAENDMLFNVLMFRNVDDKGNTIHEVPANVLEAIKELEGVA